ncbi:hypothetical protein DL96DRAFT_1801844 [Flagelloscypha sp. PMI_526]|nr:hypothetical protein DL96DRAFT_1801844 [Flagelloscypha sp. PMI_526]
MAATRTTLTITSTEPLVTAYALETAWNTAKLSASAHYTTYTWGLTPELVLDAVIVGETGSDGKFGGSIPAQTMIFGPFTPYYGFTVPIATPTETNTFDWSRMQCSPDIFDSSKFVCQWVAPDSTGLFGSKTTAISTINGLAVATIAHTTTYTTTSYTFTGIQGPFGNGNPALGYYYTDLTILIIVLLVILGLVVVCPLLVCCFVVWPRERRRKRQRNRLRQLWLERKAPYDLVSTSATDASVAERGLLLASGVTDPHSNMVQIPQTPTEVTPFMIPLPPHSPGPVPMQTEEMRQRMILMEDEIRRLRGQLDQQETAPLPLLQQLPEPPYVLAQSIQVNVVAFSQLFHGPSSRLDFTE